MASIINTQLNVQSFLYLFCQPLHCNVQAKDFVRVPPKNWHTAGKATWWHLSAAAAPLGPPGPTCRASWCTGCERSPWTRPRTTSWGWGPACGQCSRETPGSQIAGPLSLRSAWKMCCCLHACFVCIRLMINQGFLGHCDRLLVSGFQKTGCDIYFLYNMCFDHCRRVLVSGFQKTGCDLYFLFTCVFGHCRRVLR